MDKIDKCPKRPRNLKEFLRSPWFLKPVLILAVGTAIGLLIYTFLGNNPYTNNIFGDILAGNIIGLFFISIPCLHCNFNNEL